MAVNRASDWNLAFDDFDSFRDLSHLARMTVSKIEERIPDCQVFFFIHNLGLKEYREEDKEGMFCLAEDNPLITYLALKNRIIDRMSLKNEAFFKDDSINAFLFIEQLKISTLIPLVYRFQLLGFLGIRHPAGKKRLNKDERAYCNTLSAELIQNLYAAILIDQRFSELVSLSDLGKEISAVDSIPQLYEIFFGKLRKLLPFDNGSLWINGESANEEADILQLKAWYGWEPPAGGSKLKEGDSISGYVFRVGKPLLIKNLQKNSFFMDRNQETGLTHSILSLPLKTNETIIGVLTLHNKSRKSEFTGEVLHLVSILCNITAAAITGKRLYNKLEKGYLDTITALVAALDAKDPYTAGHSERVMLYAEGIAEEMRLSEDRIRLLRFAALLHDIGKIGIKGEIIRKESQLTDEEFKIIRQHPIIGEQIISAIEFLREIKTYIKYHHERYDGSGYYKKNFEEIPVEALILNIADSFDAMTTNRPYRKGYSMTEALSMMEEEVGHQFDPQAFKAFVTHLQKKGLIVP